MSPLFAALALMLPPPDPVELVGTWDVALYFSADAPPSATVMVVETEAEGVLTGTFYATPFSEARARVFQGEVVFTILTEDGSGPYLTSGTLQSNGEIKGQTLSVGRDFLMGWTATRRERETP